MPGLQVAWLVWAGVVVTLTAIHLVASGGTGTIRPSVEGSVAITPATTISHAWRHAIAGLFHTSWGHIAFNLALFSAAYPLAIQAASLARVLGTAYLIGPVSVFTLHVTVVRPMASAGVAYAVDAMQRPLVGFSVIAYATAGIAVRELAKTTRLGALGLVVFVVLFESFMGLTRRTGPFIFVYHLMGFTVGMLAGFFLLDRGASGGPTPGFGAAPL